MKNTKFYSCLCALFMIFMASANALAQELTVKTASFLKPGEKGTLTIGLKNATDVDAFQAYVTLPEGLSFVPKTEGSERFVANKASRMEGLKGWTLSLQQKKSDKQTAALLALGDEGIKAGEGDIVTFEVNVDANYTGANNIVLSGIQLTDTEGGYVTPADVQGKVCSTDEQVFVTAAMDPIVVGTPQTITFNLDFAKQIVRYAAFQVVLPQGLTVVEGSPEAGSICPNHEAAYVDGQVTVMVDDIFENDDFSATKGDFASFKVVADDSFVDGSEILIKNVNVLGNVAGETGKFARYYGEDFNIKVSLDQSTGINGVNADEFAEGADGIYQINGVRTDKMQRGVNIVVKNGKAVKVVKK